MASDYLNRGGWFVLKLPENKYCIRVPCPLDGERRDCCFSPIVELAQAATGEEIEFVSNVHLRNGESHCIQSSSLAFSFL